MTLKEFNNKYQYKTDVKRFNTYLDIWELPNDSDIIRADCESYCRFLKNNIEGFKDWDYYYCKLSGSGHCILYKDGNVIDCNIRSIVSLEQYNRIFTVTEFSKYHWFVVASKIAFAKVYTLFNKGSNDE